MSEKIEQPTVNKYNKVTLIDDSVVQPLMQGKFKEAAYALGANMYAAGKDFVDDVPQMREELGALVGGIAKETYGAMKDVVKTPSALVKYASASFGKQARVAKATQRKVADQRLETVLGISLDTATSFQRDIAGKSAIDMYKARNDDPAMRSQMIVYAVRAAQVDNDSEAFEVMLKDAVAEPHPSVEFIGVLSRIHRALEEREVDTLYAKVRKTPGNETFKRDVRQAMAQYAHQG